MTPPKATPNRKGKVCKPANDTLGNSLKVESKRLLEFLIDTFNNHRREMIESGEFEKIFGYTPKIDKDESKF